MAVIDHFEIGGVFYDVQDIAATNKNAQQDTEIGSLQNRVSTVEQEVRRPNKLYNREVRNFVTAASVFTWTANHDGFLRVSVMKKTPSYTVFMNVNGEDMSSESYYGTDAAGTQLNLPVYSATLTAWVKEGDQIVVYSNEQAVPTTDSWYVAGLNLQYVA